MSEHCRPDGERPSDLVLRRVADREGTELTELERPLDDVVDLEALDSLFADRIDGHPRPGGTITFEYCGYTVTVDDGGAVELEETE